MRNRTYHTPMNLLLEPDMYQHLRMTAKLQKTTMSKIIRDGIQNELARIDKENDAVIGGEK